MIADDTGLGKTAEAGIILTRLLQRRQADRVLVLSKADPDPGRWVGELQEKFGLDFRAIADGRDYGRRRRQVPAHLNVFATSSATPWRCATSPSTSQLRVRPWPSPSTRRATSCTRPAASFGVSRIVFRSSERQDPRQNVVEYRYCQTCAVVTERLDAAACEECGDRLFPGRYADFEAAEGRPVEAIRSTEEYRLRSSYDLRTVLGPRDRVDRRRWGGWVSDLSRGRTVEIYNRGFLPGGGWHLLRAKAMDLLRDGTVEMGYDAVVVDEAQDLTETSVRLLVEVAGGLPRPRLTVVGDGQQSIYPGGFSLRSLGVAVRGRSTVLRTNWRNTYAIWMAANAFIAGEAFDDLEDEDATLRGDEESPYPLRDGQAPRLSLLDGAASEECEWVAELVADDLRAGTDPGDCAVVAPTNSAVRPLEQALRAAGVPTAPLTTYQGTHRPRAKGLEFKRLYLTGLAADRWPASVKGLDDGAMEAVRARQHRAAFVAMTRARDQLDVVVAGQPATALEAAEWAFDR